MFLHGLLFGFGFAVAFILVGSIMRRGLGRTIGGMFKLLFWIMTAIAAVVMFWWPPASVVPAIALLAWIFFANPWERDSDPMWANVFGFTLCVGVVLFVMVAHLAGHDQAAPQEASARAPGTTWMDDLDHSKNR
jgi:hypothetical protein